MPRKKQTITPFVKQKLCTDGISCGFTCIGASRSCKTKLEGEGLKAAKEFQGLIFEFDPELNQLVKRIGDKKVPIEDTRLPEENEE